MKSKNIITDERVLSAQQKIAGNAYSLVIILLFLSMLVKIYVMELPFAAWVTELSVILISAAYVAAANLLGGNAGYALRQESVRTYALKSAVSGVVVSVSVSTVNYFRYPQNRENLLAFFISAAILFISSFAFTFLTLLFVGWATKKSELRLKKRFDEEEQRP